MMIDIGLKFLFTATPTPAYDLKVKVTDLELSAILASLRVFILTLNLETTYAGSGQTWHK